MTLYLLGALVAMLCVVCVYGLVRGAHKSTATSPPRPNDMSVRNKGRGPGHMTRSAGAAGGGIYNASPPLMSGIPQARQQWSAYGGEYSAAPTHYRYNIKKLSPVDGSTVSTTTVTQAVASGNAETYTWTRPDSDAYYDFGLSVDVSFDGGVTYPLTTSATVNPTYPTPVILPWVISDPTVAYTSGYTPGSNPLLVDIGGNLIPSLRLLVKVEDSALATLKYFGEIAIPESARNSPLSIDLSGATDPAPVPAIPTLAATDIVSFQLATPDYQYAGTTQGSGTGSASEWIAISPTAATGRTRLRITNTNASNAAFVPLIEVMKGGINILNTVRAGNAFFGRCCRGSYTKDQWDTTLQRTPSNMLAPSPYTSLTYFDANGAWVEIDFFTTDLTGATLNIHSQSPYAPLTDYTVTEYGSTGTLLNTITRTALTYTANETKTETL